MRRRRHDRRRGDEAGSVDVVAVPELAAGRLDGVAARARARREVDAAGGDGGVATGSPISCRRRSSTGTGQPEAGVGGRAKPRLWLRPPEAAGAMDGPAAVKQARGVCTQPQAQAGRHVAGDRERRKAPRGGDRRAWGRRSCHGRMLRRKSESQAPLARHVSDCLGQADGPGGGGVSTCVPHLRRRHPAHCLHHGAGADPENPHASWRTARAATSVARSWPAHRLGRDRPSP